MYYVCTVHIAQTHRHIDGGGAGQLCKRTYVYTKPKLECIKWRVEDQNIIRILSRYKHHYYYYCSFVEECWNFSMWQINQTCVFFRLCKLQTTACGLTHVISRDISSVYAYIKPPTTCVAMPCHERNEHRSCQLKHFERLRQKKRGVECHYFITHNTPSMPITVSHINGVADIASHLCQFDHKNANNYTGYNLRQRCGWTGASLHTSEAAAGSSYVSLCNRTETRMKQMQNCRPVNEQVMQVFLIIACATTSTNTQPVVVALLIGGVVCAVLALLDAADNRTVTSSTAAYSVGVEGMCVCCVDCMCE